jgi:large subunit ribosomal protein L25
MTELKLAARSRAKTPQSEAKAERKNGNIAAVMYGHGKPATSLWVERIAFEKLYAQAGESSIIHIDVDGKSHNALVQDVSFDPLAHRAIHIDFLQVKMNEVIEVTVPLEFIGESKAVRELSGTLITTLEEVQVSCLPGNLPHALEINLEKLATFEDRLVVADIVLPKDVTLLTDPETVVATVEEPRSDEDMAALDEKVEGDVTKVEGVIKTDDSAPAAEEKK